MRFKIETLIGAAALLGCLVSCQKFGTLSGTKDKTPVEICANFDEPSFVGGWPSTKAADGSFAKTDELLVFLQHVSGPGTEGAGYTDAPVVTGTGVGPVLATLKVGDLTAEHYNVVDNYTNHTSSSVITTVPMLYWDDFNNSASADTDIRTSGHALQVKYGYCYNGGTPSTPMTTDVQKDAGQIGWTVATNQSSGLKTSDLLFAKTEQPVQYKHAKDQDDHLTVNYTHAMSKITVVVKCDPEAFDSGTDNFAGTSVVLKDMCTLATVDAPIEKVTPSTVDTDIKDVTMYKVLAASVSGDINPYLQQSYSAVVAPSVIKGSETAFAVIKGLNHTDYWVKLTSAAIEGTNTTPNQTNPWSSKLAAYDSGFVTPHSATAYTTADGGLTIPGVNYLVTVTISKQKVEIKAEIKNWEDVTAQGVGNITFTTDVHDITTDDTLDEFHDGFDLYSRTASQGSFGSKLSTITYSAGNWLSDPQLYWQRSDESRYFRAISPINGNYNKLKNGTDILWGTTAAHEGKDSNNQTVTFPQGSLIQPRTSVVPMKFYHPVSKITIHIKDANAGTSHGHSSDPALDLNGAKVQISSIYTEGKLSLDSGEVTNTGSLGNAFTDPGYDPASINGTSVTSDKRIKDYVVMPQTINVNSIIKITLTNGLTFSAKTYNIPSFTDDGNGNWVQGAAITQWEPGKHYIYTLTLTKGVISFRAMIQDWEDTNAGGNAEMDW